MASGSGAGAAAAEASHVFTQALMARGAVPETEARELYRRTTKTHDGARAQQPIWRVARLR